MTGGRPHVSIVSSGHDVADARMHREVAVLRRAGLQVEVLALGDPAAGPEGAQVRTWRRAPGWRRAVLALALPWRARGRVLIALDPDSTAGTIVRKFLTPPSRRPKVVADVHEDYLLVLRDRPWASGIRRLAGEAFAHLGRGATRRADVVVVADHHLMTEVPDRVVLRNVPDLAMMPPPSPLDPDPRALYVGDLRSSRGLFLMLESIAEAPGWSLDLVGPMAGADRAAFMDRLAELDLAERVRWFGRMPPCEAWRLARGAWVGLLMLEDTPAFRAAMPSKLYEYLSSGLAVISTELPRPAELIRSTGTGAVVADPSEAAEVLRGWAETPAGLELCRQRSREAVEGLFAENEDLKGFAEAVRSLGWPEASPPQNA